MINHKHSIYLKRNRKNCIGTIIKWMNELCFTVVVLNLNKFLTIDFNKQILNKKWNFPLRISSVNVTKSAVSCGFDHIYWRNSQWKTSFFVQWKISNTCFQQSLCLDYSNLQERRNISKLYMIVREHIFPVYGLRNECSWQYFLQTKEVPNENSLGWNKVSGCHTKPTWASFLLTW